ncbi:VWA domain-containing protein [Candidatus Omnitrophota bacterium]
MRFAQAGYSFGFWMVLGLVLFLIWSRRKNRLLLRNFAEQKLLSQLTRNVNFKRQKIKLFLIVLSLILALLGLMRPQWGFQWREVKRTGLDILIAMDVSKSMLTADVLPNRLQRSKLAVRDLVKKLTGDRIGLIAFSGSAFLQCPLTVDYNGFLLALNDLNVNTIPRGGTSISSAIKRAVVSYEGGQKKYKILVIITDGEDHEGDALKLARDAAEAGVRIYCIGIGTTEGELIQLSDKSGRKVFLKDRSGNVVKSRLDEELLRQMALTTGGAYVRSSGAQFGLDYIYENNLSLLERREIKSRMSRFYHERFQIPLSLALLLLMVEPLIGDKKKR